MISYQLTFLTPLFSKGSYDDLPEIRPPSIRGQLHWWFRALGGNAVDEKAIFGGVHGGAASSRVVVRVGNIKGGMGEWNTLPHKHGAQASPKMAYQPGTACDLYFLFRLGGLNDSLRPAFDRAVEAWLLLGTLGLRATRAGGSFCWRPLRTPDAPDAPPSLEDYRARCQRLLHHAPLRFHLIEAPFESAEEARHVVSDTIGGRDDQHGDNSLALIHHPLGKIGRGERKTSPLRFRIIQIGNRFHIAAVWDDRLEVTGNRQGDLQAVIKLLCDKNKRIGMLLDGGMR